MKAHTALAQALTDHGVDVLFGLPGDANLDMVYDFVHGQGRTFVSAAHEAGAVLMAHGYAHTSGRVGVATVTHGPAFTNTITPLIEAVRSRTPLVLIAGDTPGDHPDHLQNCDQREILLGTGAALEQVRSPHHLVTDFATAMRRAMVERRPVVLNSPVDYQHVDTEYAPVGDRFVGAQAIGPDHAVLDQAVGLIAAANRPIVLAGRGVATPGARAAVLGLARELGAPVATSLKAKDLFRDEDLDLGVFGTLSHRVAADEIAASDCVIAFGASLNKWTTDAGALLRGKRVVHCDIDPAAIGRDAAVDVGVVGDCQAVAELAVEWLRQAGTADGRGRAEDVAARLDSLIDTFTDASTDGTIDLRTALLAIEAAVPRDRTLVTDGGQFLFEALTRLRVPHPSQFVLGVNFGSIGLGMGNAIGAAYGAPEHPTLLITGDGGFMLGGLVEFNTAVRHGVDLITVICNNGTYGPEYVHFRQRGQDPSLSLFDWPDFADVAIALGGAGLTVRNRDDLARLPAVIEQRDRPLLIDLKLDPELTPAERERHA